MECPKKMAKKKVVSKKKRTRPLTTDEILAIRRQLIKWYDEEHRPLPWRTTPSEYSTVISEFMLQQTQVATVIPYFEAFLKQFPSFEKLAEAAEQDVLAAWSGLGYYRRARMLKRAAEIIVRDHGGRLPREPEELAKLPGFGEYTVGAVGSIALNMRLPLVDGNVRRVVGRLLALEGDLMKGPGKKTLWEKCELLVSHDRPGDFNQALMELGATVCLPREPLCLICPLFELCRARARGIPEAYPLKPRRPKMKAVREVAVALFKGEKLLVLQRGEGSSFAGLWELPRLDTRTVPDETLTAEHVLFEVIRSRPAGAESVGNAESTFTHHKIKTELFRAEIAPRQTIRRQSHIAHQWLAPQALRDIPASKAQHRLFDLLEKK